MAVEGYGDGADTSLDAYRQVLIVDLGDRLGAGDALDHARHVREKIPGDIHGRGDFEVLLNLHGVSR